MLQVLPTLSPLPRVQAHAPAVAVALPLPAAATPRAAAPRVLLSAVRAAVSGVQEEVSSPRAAQVSPLAGLEAAARGVQDETGARAQGAIESDVSSARARFDGMRIPAGAALPTPVPAAEPGSVRRASPSDVLSPAAELENGRTASGLAPPAARPLEDYRPPAGLMLSRAVLRASHFALLAASYAVLGAGLGGVAATVSAAWVGGKLLWEYRRSTPSAEAVPAAEAQDDYTVWLRGLLNGLAGRLGLPAEKIPRIVVSNERGTFGASSYGKALDERADITVGEGFARLPVEMTLGVLAHELGHLALGDFSVTRVFQNRLGFRVCLEILRDVAVRGGAVLLVEAVLGFVAWKAALLGAVVALGAFPVACAGLMLGLAVSRREELRADHFAGWLTDPRWMADFLRFREAARKEALEVPESRFDAFLRVLGSTHPSFPDRIRRLEAGIRRGG